MQMLGITFLCVILLSVELAIPDLSASSRVEYPHSLLKKFILDAVKVRISGMLFIVTSFLINHMVVPIGVQ